MHQLQQRLRTLLDYLSQPAPLALRSSDNLPKERSQGHHHPIPPYFLTYLGNNYYEKDFRSSIHEFYESCSQKIIDRNYQLYCMEFEELELLYEEDTDKLREKSE